MEFLAFFAVVVWMDGVRPAKVSQVTHHTTPGSPGGATLSACPSD